MIFPWLTMKLLWSKRQAQHSQTLNATSLNHSTHQYSKPMTTELFAWVLLTEAKTAATKLNVISSQFGTPWEGTNHCTVHSSHQLTGVVWEHGIQDERGYSQGWNGVRSTVALVASIWYFAEVERSCEMRGGHCAHFSRLVARHRFSMLKLFTARRFLVGHVYIILEVLDRVIGWVMFSLRTEYCVPILRIFYHRIFSFVRFPVWVVFCVWQTLGCCTVRNFFLLFPCGGRNPDEVNRWSGRREWEKVQRT